MFLNGIRIVWSMPVRVLELHQTQAGFCTASLVVRLPNLTLLHRFLNCSLYCSWQVCVLLARSCLPIMHCIHLLVGGKCQIHS